MGIHLEASTRGVLDGYVLQHTRISSTLHTPWKVSWRVKPAHAVWQKAWGKPLHPGKAMVIQLAFTRYYKSWDVVNRDVVVRDVLKYKVCTAPKRLKSNPMAIIKEELITL